MAGSVFAAGITLSHDICLLMLIRYGSPNLHMDFVGFVLLMLRAEKMEGELGAEGGRGSLCAARGSPTCPQSKQEGEQHPVWTNNRPGSSGGAGGVPAAWLHPPNSPAPRLSRGGGLRQLTYNTCGHMWVHSWVPR